MAHLTHSTKPFSEKLIDRKWHLIDVQGKIVGRVAPHIATLLQGKQKPSYAPYIDNGDYVVVINAAYVKLSGSKLKNKMYSQYSGYPDGMKETTAGEMMKKNPTRVIKNAVSGMLPKNKLRDKRL